MKNYNYLSSLIQLAASECNVDNGGCDHYCTETIQSYVCSCYPGYTLDTDQHTCTGETTYFGIVMKHPVMCFGRELYFILHAIQMQTTVLWRAVFVW